MSDNLVQLAEKYIRLTGEIEDVRRGMLACLANGAGAGDAPRPPQPARAPGGSTRRRRWRRRPRRGSSIS